jgi:hypothetical protein
VYMSICAVHTEEEIVFPWLLYQFSRIVHEEAACCWNIFLFFAIFVVVAAPSHQEIRYDVEDMTESGWCWWVMRKKDGFLVDA